MPGPIEGRLEEKPRQGGGGYKGQWSARNEGENQLEDCPPITLLKDQYQPVAF